MARLNAGEKREKQTPAKNVSDKPMKVLFPNICKQTQECDKHGMRFSLQPTVKSDIFHYIGLTLLQQYILDLKYKPIAIFKGAVNI